MQPKCGGCTVDKYSGATYQFCEKTVDRASAEAACVSHGGHLATVSDVFLNSYLRGLAPNVGGAYIGLSDESSPGRYVWATGKAADYVNWASGQPDNWMMQEHCVQLSDGKAITQWNDISCGTKLPYLCQLP
jgi:hypothetical protein